MRTLLDRTQSASHNRTPPPIYRARVDPPPVNPLPLLNQLNMGLQRQPVYHQHAQLAPPPQRSAPPSYRFRPAAAVTQDASGGEGNGGGGRERASLGQINAMFNENYRSAEGGCDPDRQPAACPGDGQSSTSGRRAHASGQSSSSPKNFHNRNMELLAQL